MSDHSPEVLDLNQADLQDLVKLPSITPAIAEKIIAGRPYQSLQDLRRVNGIGKATVQRLQPYLLVSAPGIDSPPHTLEASAPPAAQAPVLPALEAPATEPETEPEGQTPHSAPAGEDFQTVERESAAEAAFPYPEPPPPEILPAPSEHKHTETSASPSGNVPAQESSPPKENRSWLAVLTADPDKAVLWGTAVVLLVLFLSLLLNLAALAAINGGIRYASSGRAALLEQRFSVLKGDVESLQQESNSLRTRLDTLEALSGRIDTLEKDSAALRTQSEQLSSQVDGLNKRLEEVSSQFSQLDRRVTVFDRFLEGMRSLLAETTPVQP